MAVENKYVDSDLQSNKRAAAANAEVGQQWGAVVTFEVAAADDNGSVYRLLKALNPDLIITKADIYNDAITGATDYDLGLYETTGDDGVNGPEVDKDVFLDGADIAAGNAAGSPQEGLATVNLANRAKKLYEHAGHTLATRKPSYDIALTANAVGSAAGTITVLFGFLQG